MKKLAPVIILHEVAAIEGYNAWRNHSKCPYEYGPNHETWWRCFNAKSEYEARKMELRQHIKAISDAKRQAQRS